MEIRASLVMVTVFSRSSNIHRDDGSVAGECRRRLDAERVGFEVATVVRARCGVSAEDWNLRRSPQEWLATRSVVEYISGWQIVEVRKGRA